MDDDYDDFFRQDISEGKDDDEDKDIPSVSLFLKSTIDSEFNVVNFSQLWELSASELDTARPEWQPGQVRTFIWLLLCNMKMIDIAEICSIPSFPPGCRRHEEDVPPCVRGKSKQWRIRHRSDDFQSWRLPEYVYDDSLTLLV